MANKQQLIERFKKLEALKAELERRAGKDRLLNYTPHPKQKLLHGAINSHKIVIALCGNRWGKTECLIAEALSQALGYRPWDNTKTRTPPSKILICVPQFAAISDYIVPKLDKLEPDGFRLPGREGRKYGHAGVESSRHYTNGSMIAFASYVQPPEAFQGRDWDFIGLDETVPKEIFDVLLMRTVDRKGKLMMTLTPENMGSAWIFDDIYSMAGKDDTIFQITGASYDNPNIPREELEAMEKRFSPEEREAKLYGKFKHLMGRVYPMYDEEIHCYDETKVKIEASWPKGLVIDPHDRKPFAMGWFAVSPSNDIYFFEEWPPDNFLDHKTPHSFDEYVSIIEAIERSIPGGTESIAWRLIDPNFGRSKKAVSGQSVEEAFADYKLYFDSNINDDVTTGHIAVKQKLSYDKTLPRSEINKPKLYFKKGLTNFHRAFLNYTYDTRRMEMEKGVTERPKERYKDFCLARGTLIKTIHGDIPIENIKPGMFALTDIGPKEILAQAQTGQNVETYTVQFSDGSTLTGTGNHKVFLQNGKKIPIDLLRYRDMVSAWEGKRPTTGSLAGVDTISLDLDFFTEKSGRSILDQSQRECISTIKTETDSIIESETLNSLQSKSTGQSIPWMTSEESGSHGISAREAIGPKRWRPGTNPKKVERGPRSISSKHGGIESQKKETASNASQGSSLRSASKASSAQITANLPSEESLALIMREGNASYVKNRSLSINTEKPKLVHLPALEVLTVKRSSKSDVFDLTIDEAHRYYANGILVSNCDIVRYCVMFEPTFITKEDSFHNDLKMIERIARSRVR